MGPLKRLAWERRRRQDHPGGQPSLNVRGKRQISLPCHPRDLPSSLLRRNSGLTGSRKSKCHRHSLESRHGSKHPFTSTSAPRQCPAARRQAPLSKVSISANKTASNSSSTRREPQPRGTCRGQGIKREESGAGCHDTMANSSVAASNLHPSQVRAARMNPGTGTQQPRLDFLAFFPTIDEEPAPSPPHQGL